MIIVDTQNNSDLKYEAQTPSGCKVIAILVDHQKVLLLVGTAVVALVGMATCFGFVKG